MKLLVQSDDYGITRASAQGCLHGIHNGTVRNTGLFANMPWAEECVEWIKPDLDKIGFGIDLNLSTGPSLLGHDKVPHLTHEDGSFLTSGENRALDNKENGFDHLEHYEDEVRAEFEAQIQKFIALVGRKPDYIHAHAYGTATVCRIIHEMAQKYHVPCSIALSDEVRQAGMGWYSQGDSQVQLQGDLMSYLKKDPGHMLESEYGYLITHCGYVDDELIRLSSFNTCRVKDLAAITSPEMKQWIDQNHIELITFKDLPERFSC